MIRPYASRTGTRRNLEVMREHGWGLLISATGCVRTEGWPGYGLPYALDNGAWTAFQQGTEFNAVAFERALDLVGEGAEWVVIPDVVGNARASLDSLHHWYPRLRKRNLKQLLIAVQDGMTQVSIEAFIRYAKESGDQLGIFVGGTTDWKWHSLPYWSKTAQRMNCYLHVGRVNSQEKIQECTRFNADSFDGTSVTKYAVTCRPLDAAARQGSLLPDSMEG